MAQRDRWDLIQGHEDKVRESVFKRKRRLCVYAWAAVPGRLRLGRFARPWDAGWRTLRTGAPVCQRPFTVDSEDTGPPREGLQPAQRHPATT